jgi:hypothetical protein
MIREGRVLLFGTQELRKMGLAKAAKGAKEGKSSPFLRFLRGLREKPLLLHSELVLI